MLFIDDMKIDTGVFPNGESWISTEFEEYQYNKYIVKITVKFEDNNDLVNLMLLKKHLDNNGVRSRLEILYFPYSRMDRENNSYIFSLKYIAQFINSLGFYKVTIMEAHSDVTPALINNVNSFSWIINNIERIKKEINFNENTDLVCYPDAGALKRYSKELKTRYCYGNKIRDFATGEITDHELVVTGLAVPSRVLIVDDLCSRGGTFYAMAKQLIERFGENIDIYLAVAHCETNVFNGELIKDNSPIYKIFTSNSITLPPHRKIEVINA